MSKILSYEQNETDWQIIIAESTWDPFNFVRTADQRINGREPVEEIITWCDSHIGRGNWRAGTTEESYDGHGHWIVKFFFRTEAYAAWFLLRWGGFIKKTEHDRLDFWTD